METLSHAFLFDANVVKDAAAWKNNLQERHPLVDQACATVPLVGVGKQEALACSGHKCRVVTVFQLHLATPFHQRCCHCAHNFPRRRRGV